MYGTYKQCQYENIYKVSLYYKVDNITVSYLC